jgi:ATP-dependent DNA helicase RecQ
MHKDTLTHLGLTPDQTGHITGNQRKRLIGLLLRWEQFDAALACLEEMWAFKPGLVTLLDAQARALVGLEQPDAALDVMHARHQLRTSLSSRALEARVHLARGDNEAALRIADELVAERSEIISGWGLLGQVHVARGDFEAALAGYGRLADQFPDSRTYLLGMLALHQARGDFVTASGYAVRMQRRIAEGEVLPATTLRTLRDYYQASGETNRAQDMEAALAALYEAELVELEAALADELRILTRQPGAPSPMAEARPAGPVAEPLPEPDAVPVSSQERQRLEQATQRHFGFSSLLPGQAETMAAALRDQDVLTVLPTGGGKSLCYQLPALLDDGGATLVISPLIALMKDQVDSLPDPVRSRATTINSSLEGAELQRRMRGVAGGRYRLVYAAPERLRQPPFLHALRRAGLNRLVIDEAHCISVWGHDFRPDYLHIAQARHALGDPPVLAMTATAPPRVRRDIVQRLQGPGAESGDGMAVVAADVYRPNLYLAAIRARNADEKLQLLLALCQAETGSGIVYAGTRDRCESIAALLRGRGISAGYYHAGIGDRVARAAAQDSFMSGETRIMVATIAFGMGIDKANIRFIVHFQLPASLESYYQEAGRAGRDGLPARCVLIYSSADRATLTRRAKGDALPIEFLRSVYAAVKHRLRNGKMGRVATGDLMRDVRAEDTPVRVALATLEEAGLLRRHQDLPRTAVVRLRQSPEPACEASRSASGVDEGQHPELADGKQPEPSDGKQPELTGGHRPELVEGWRAFVSAARLRPGQSLPLDPLAVAQAAELDPTTIEAQLLNWVDAGWLDYRPAGRELLLELLPPPADASTRVEALIDRYATIQAQRVDEIAAYAATRRCRHGHISAYLGGWPMEECQSCDNCQPEASPIKKAISDLDMPEEQEQLQTILRCIATSPGGWGKANLTYILRGSPRASQRAQQSSEWNALSFRSRAAVEAMIDRLIYADLLQTRQLDHGGILLVLTPAGHTALQDPTRLQSLSIEPPLPVGVQEQPTDNDGENVPMDEALFERLRVWRQETAQAADVPPYVVAHDSLLRGIATVRPQTEDQLVQIKGMGPKRLDKYGAAILALLRGGDI